MYAEIGLIKEIQHLKYANLIRRSIYLILLKKVNNVKEKIETQFGNKCKIFTYGVVKGDYNWDLMKLVSNNEKDNTLTIDWFAFVLIDKLLKVGGYIEFDDYEWAIGTSPTCSPYPPTNNKQLILQKNK